MKPESNNLSSVVRSPSSAAVSIPYGRQQIDADDIAAVVEVLKSDWLTTGPKVAEFEQAFADFTHSRHAVAVANGTAALHAAMHAAGIGPGDEVIVAPMSFVASANCIVFMGGTPVFADVDPGTLLIDPAAVQSKITPKTKAIIGVDHAGLPCDWDALRAIADRHGLVLVDDACHAVGGSYKGRPVGSLADLNTFSFHPVKNMTTGEGGMVTTDNDKFARRLRMFRSHGVTVDFRQRMETNSWFYEMVELGYNYRITDFQCALGLSQLKKLPGWIGRRNEIAAMYDESFGGRGAEDGGQRTEDGERGTEDGELRTEDGGQTTDGKPPSSVIRPLAHARYAHVHGRHLYVIRVPADRRAAIFAGLREAGIGVNVHYIPIHLHPFYRERFGTGPGLCPVAESAYEEIISLPIYPGMTGKDIHAVINCLQELMSHGTEA